MYIFKGELYLKKEHVSLLKNEPEYVEKKYHTIARAITSNNNIFRENAAHDLGIGMRQFRRLLKRFQDEGIPGLRYKSKRPHRSPNKTTHLLEDLVVNVRNKTGFGSFHLSLIVNISLENQGKMERVNPRTVSRILVRRGIIETEKRAKKEWKRFEWGHPNHLVQTDLTKFNGVPILTM